MDFFEALTSIRHAYPDLPESEIRAALDAEVKSEEERLTGRNKYARAVENAHSRLLAWLKDGDEYSVQVENLESLCGFIASHRQACVWGTLRAKLRNRQTPNPAWKELYRQSAGTDTTPAIDPPVAEEQLRAALGNLIQWSVGNRGTKDCNPYAIPEIRAALKTLAIAKGWSETRVKSGYYDAADEYIAAYDMAQKLKGDRP